MNLPKSYDQWRTEESYPKMRYQFLCEDCDTPVYEGETYYEIDGFNYCTGCIDHEYRHSTEADETCSYCGGDIAYDEMATNIHGGWICDTCLELECKRVANE